MQPVSFINHHITIKILINRILLANRISYFNTLNSKTQIKYIVHHYHQNLLIMIKMHFLINIMYQTYPIKRLFLTLTLILYSACKVPQRIRHNQLNGKQESILQINFHVLIQVQMF